MTPVLKKHYIDAIYAQKAFLIRDELFTLHRGGTSHLFLSHSHFLSQYKNLKLLSELYASMIPSDVSDYSLAAVDSVMSPVVTGMLSLKLEKDVVVIKEKKLEHGLENQLYGKPQKEVILIDDVTSTGTILINAAELLRKDNVVVRYAILSACRDLQAIEKLKEAHITCLFIATYEEIITTLWPQLTESEKNCVRDEVKVKGYAWHLPSEM